MHTSLQLLVAVACNRHWPLVAACCATSWQHGSPAWLLLQVNACDCVVGKIGYGTVSEVLAHNKPFVFIRRDFFNEVGQCVA